MASAHRRALGPFLFWADHLVFKGHALRVILLKPPFRGIPVGKNFEVIWVADLFAGVDINPDGLHLVNLRALASPLA